MPPSSIDYSSLSNYRCLVVDSGPIIRHELAHLAYTNGDVQLYTVPGVIQEVRDAAARQQLSNLSSKLTVREPTPNSIQTILTFARKTGDMHSLSTVDLHVLALVYELEREGCNGNVEHIRTTPKRVLGLGKFETLATNKAKDSTSGDGGATAEGVQHGVVVSDDEGDAVSSCSSEEEASESEEPDITEPTSAPPCAASPPKSWAALLDPQVKEFADDIATAGAPLAHVLQEGGQFSDAEEEDDALQEVDTAVELEKEFPSLAAASTVPYESDNDADSANAAEEQKMLEEKEEEERKKRSLQPISKSGKLYNSFTKYGDLMRPKPKEISIASTTKSELAEESKETQREEITETKQPSQPPTSRLLNSGIAGQGDQDEAFEDDGEGWITSTKEIRVMKSNGQLDPTHAPTQQKPNSADAPAGPPLSQRTACATTDFAMQNVLLQMNLELVSATDGMKIRKLKSWVLRCGACYKVHTNADGTGPLKDKRLFCKHCGSDMMQRIAASVDGKTGRLRLHLSKKYRHNLRGTKFSLPKPGTNNRFQGDLLLREDQLLMRGAWHQKAKMRSGGKAKCAAESMFGREVATTVGCHAAAGSLDDIRVGFGRRNPNAAKGRERRGKKKKSANRACGLRRY